MSRFRTILTAGLAAGVLDLSYAFIERALHGSPPTRVLQAIASGLLGSASFEGGASTAALGLALHFLIAGAASAMYVIASRQLRVLVERPWICGPLYGVAVWAVMVRLVLPLSAIPWKVSTAPAAVVSQLAAHTLCVGLPIALVVSRASRRSATARTSPPGPAAGRGSS